MRKKNFVIFVLGTFQILWNVRESGWKNNSDCVSQKVRYAPGPRFYALRFNGKSSLFSPYLLLVLAMRSGAHFRCVTGAWVARCIVRAGLREPRFYSFPVPGCPWNRGPIVIRRPKEETFIMSSPNQQLFSKSSQIFLIL